jgi:hypothetical protein
MALGTVTKVTKHGRSIDFADGDRKTVYRDVQLSAGANYTTGGETLTPSAFGLKEIWCVEPMGPALSTAASTTFQVGFNYSTGKLMAFGQNATPGAAVAQPQVTANTNLSTFVVRLRVEGRAA